MSEEINTGSIHLFVGHTGDTRYKLISDVVSKNKDRLYIIDSCAQNISSAIQYIESVHPFIEHLSGKWETSPNLHIATTLVESLLRALVLIPDNHIVVLDSPEAYLDTEFITIICGLLSTMCDDKGTDILITTESQILVDMFRVLIARGYLTKNQLKLTYLYKGVTKETTFGDYGQYIDYPEPMFSGHHNLMCEILRTGVDAHKSRIESTTTEEQ